MTTQNSGYLWKIVIIVSVQCCILIGINKIDKTVNSSAVGKTNRMYPRSPMQTEKSQPQGKRIMLETRLTEFQTLSVDPRLGISRSASETDD